MSQLSPSRQEHAHRGARHRVEQLSRVDAVRANLEQPIRE
jgi:hypothetical protein